MPLICEDDKYRNEFFRKWESFFFDFADKKNIYKVISQIILKSVT